MPIITAQQLTKHFRTPRKAPGTVGAIKHIIRPHYEERIAVAGIDLTIEAGESVGYVGANGAGKSTTIKLLTGILHPTAGAVRVNGLDPFGQRIANAQNIGVVFGQRTQLWWDLPVQDSLRLLGDIYRVPAATLRRTLGECIDLLDLEPLLTKPVRQLSLGQRMRCDLAAALLHAPPILFLDEPTIGLDVAVKARIRQFIQRSNQERGVTVLLTSHDLDDIEEICTRLVMIDQGQIVFDGPLQAIKDRFGSARVLHLFLHEAPADALTTAQAGLPELPPADVQQPAPQQLTVRCATTRLSAAAIAGRLLALLPIHDLRIEEPSVESIVRQLYEGQLHFA